MTSVAFDFIGKSISRPCFSLPLHLLVQCEMRRNKRHMKNHHEDKKKRLFPPLFFPFSGIIRLSNDRVTESCAKETDNGV